MWRCGSRRKPVLPHGLFRRPPLSALPIKGLREACRSADSGNEPAAKPPRPVREQAVAPQHALVAQHGYVGHRRDRMAPHSRLFAPALHSGRRSHRPHPRRARRNGPGRQHRDRLHRRPRRHRRGTQPLRQRRLLLRRGLAHSADDLSAGHGAGRTRRVRLPHRRRRNALLPPRQRTAWKPSLRCTESASSCSWRVGLHPDRVPGTTGGRAVSHQRARRQKPAPPCRWRETGIRRLPQRGVRTVSALPSGRCTPSQPPRCR